MLSFNQKQQGKRTEVCPDCRGTGKVMHNSVWSWGWKKCGTCKGEGYVEIILPSQTKGGMFGRPRGI